MVFFNKISIDFFAVSVIIGTVYWRNMGRKGERKDERTVSADLADPVGSVGGNAFGRFYLSRQFLAWVFD